jgi:hypothetical protein
MIGPAACPRGGAGDPERDGMSAPGTASSLRNIAMPPRLQEKLTVHLP